MKLCDCLDNFRETCQEMLRLGVEENRFLRAGESPKENFLEKKRQGLSRLESALGTLRTQGGSVAIEEKSKARGVRGEVQQMLMRLMLLDRENEQILQQTLLRSSFGARGGDMVGNLFRTEGGK